MATTTADLTTRRDPRTFSDRVAYSFTKFLRFIADTFFAKRYGHRAVVLETIAAVPGMVGATLQHLKSLRHMQDDGGWIHTLMAEAENERMHLMTFVEIAKPNWLERWLVLLAQGIPSTSPKSRAGGLRILPRHKSPSITGNSRPTHASRRSSSPCGPTKQATAM
jgi:hypothetical protein